MIRVATSSGSRLSVDRIDVREHRGCARASDCLCRGVERECRADHLVSTADLEGLQRDDECVGAVRDADRVRDSEERCRLSLESLDLRPEDEAAGLENGREARLELGDQWRVLCLDVDEWDLLSHEGECSSGGV